MDWQLIEQHIEENFSLLIYISHIKLGIVKLIYNDGSFDSPYKLSMGEVRKAPRARRKPW